jgi:hypothetical protein
VVSFTPLPLYPQGKGLRYPLDRRLGGPQNQSGRRGEEKMFDPSGTRSPTLGRPVAIPSELSRLLYVNILYVFNYICFCFNMSSVYRVIYNFNITGSGEIYPQTSDRG